MEWYTLAIIFFAGILLFVSAGLPIAFSLGLVSLIGIYLLVGPKSISMVAALAWDYGTHVTLTCIPLFILMAEVVAFTGVSEDVFTAAHRWVGRLPGGLAVASTLACAGFAAVTGGSAPCAATVGIVAIPEMLERGYSKALATGCLAAGGTLGILIPPSLVMIFYGLLCEQSVGTLFIAGIVPGIMMTGLFSLYIIVRVQRNPSLGPALSGVSWRAKFASLSRVWPVLILAVLVLGVIYAGICTPTEAAGVGAFGALCISIGYRKLTWSNLRPALVRAVQTTSFIFFIVFGAISLGFLLVSLEIPQKLAALMVTLPVSRWVIMAMIMLMYAILGCFMDSLGMMVITLPVIFPIIEALKFDPIWFGVILTINMEMCNITPPVGLNLYVIKGISPPDVAISDIIRGVAPFFLLMVIGIAMVMVFPQIALWLPGTMK